MGRGTVVGVPRAPALAALTAVVGGLVIGGCGTTTTIDHADLESELREQLSADAGVDPEGVSVSCPEGIEAEEGHEFTCTLTAPDGSEAIVEVTLTDDEGSFEAVVPPQQFE